MFARCLRFLVRLFNIIATLCVVAIAALAVALIWQYYVTAPWTRDGRVRVLVANVSPQVSGQVVELRAGDNQKVKKGDILYSIDPFDFQVAVDAAKTQVQMRAADLQVKRSETIRRQALPSAAVSVDEQQQYAGNETQAQAQFANAQVQLAQAEVNLKRTNVRSPVNGYITNLTLHVGDYAAPNAPNLSIVDSDSFWVDGYFEETKLGRICVGDPVEVELMGFSQPVLGHVQSFGRGISVSDASTSTQGLPSVNPVYTWVRLAQRVPVRIHIDSVPPGLVLASGLTATVRVRSPGDDTLRHHFDNAKQEIMAFFRLGPSMDRICPQPPDSPQAVVTKLPIDEAQHPLSPDQINPGLSKELTDAAQSTERGLGTRPIKDTRFGR